MTTLRYGPKANAPGYTRTASSGRLISIPHSPPTMA